LKKLHFALMVIGGWLLFTSIGYANAPANLETGIVLDQKVTPIQGSPFYLDYRDGQTFLHDVDTKKVIEVAYEGNLTNQGLDSFRGYHIPSTDGQEIMAVASYTTERFRVTNQGDVIPFTFAEEVSATSRILVSYDATRDVVVWNDRTTYEVVVTDLNGTIMWRAPSSYHGHIILAATHDEILTIDGTTLTRFDLTTGDVLGSTKLLSEPRDVQLEPTTDLLFMPSGDLHIYDIGTAQLTKLELSYHQSMYSLTPVVYHNGIYYGTNSRDSLLEIDLVKKQVRWRNLSTYKTYSLLQGGVIVQDRSRLLSLNHVDMIPRNVSVSLRAQDEAGQGNSWLGEAYRLVATVTTSGGIDVEVPINEQGAEVLSTNGTFEEGYVIPFLEEAFRFSVRFAWLESDSLSVTPRKKLPLHVETTMTNGPVGDITGTTAPNMEVYLSCEKASYTECGGSVTSDETGRFTFSRGIITADQTITIWASNNSTYHLATELSPKQSFSIAASPINNPATVLTDTITEGLSIKTSPYAKIEVRQLLSRTTFEVTEVTADASGVAQLTSYKQTDPSKYIVFYRVKDETSPYYVVSVYKGFPIPAVTWVDSPKTFDTTITLHNEKLTPMVVVYRDGWVETSKRLTVGTNVITLKRPLWEGETIKIVASFMPEYSKTFEQKVTSDTPKTHSIKDVLVTSSTSTFTVLKDAKAYVHFYVNGRQLPHTEVGKDRYRISVKPGTSVVVESSIGSKKKRTTYKVPMASLTSFAPSDEVSMWKGKTLPNATVTVKAGTKVIGRTTANSTGSYQVKFTRQRAGTKLVFEAKVGVTRDAKSATVKAGVRPTVNTGTIRSTTKSIAVRTNVPYGTVTIYNGKTLVAKKTITSTSTNVSIKPQKRGSKLTIKVVTPANRSGQTVKTVL